ncbi:MAG: RnfABCDGE type electron transport complex subunit B [Spirochaetia bacterium]
MVFLRILYSFLAVGFLGGLLGIGLAFASRLLAVKRDERIAEVEDALPGLNCGACGYAGCASYAEAMVKEDIEITKCAPGGEDTLKELASILDKEVEMPKEKLVAQVHCRGGKGTAEYLFEYSGKKDCNALYLLYGGNKVCKFGCLGEGSCIEICPVDAIRYDKEGLVWVDRDKCISCRKCVEICPTGVIKMIPYNADVIVACNSTDKGGLVRKYCKVGCIGCRICAKKSPEGGFEFDKHLAVINYAANGDRTAAMNSCPTKCIIEAGDSKEEEQGVKEKEKVVHEKD